MVSVENNLCFWVIGAKSYSSGVYDGREAREKVQEDDSCDHSMVVDRHFEELTVV